MAQVVDRTKRTKEREERFLSVLAEGYSVYKAAKAAGVSRSQAYLWRSKDEDFARRWDEAVEAGTDTLEDESVDRAMEKSDLLLIFNLKARRREKFGDSLDHKVSGNITVSVTSYAPPTIEGQAEEVKVIENE